MSSTSAHRSFQTKATPELNARIHGTLRPFISGFEVGPYLSVSDSINRVFTFIARDIGRDPDELYPTWRQKRSVMQSNPALRAEEDATFLQRILSETRKSESSEADFQFLLDEVMTFVIPISPQQAVAVLQAAEEEVKNILREFLAQGDPLPPWEPSHILPHSSFLRKLKIPRTPGGENVPDMLLHDLGNVKKGSSLDRAIRNIFLKAPPPVVSLVNAPGAGKTKTMIEGLCGHWGFYLTCAVDSEGRGSRDLSIAFNKHIKLDPAFVENLEEAAKKDENVTLSSLHRVNCEIARSRISEVLLARICILTWFLDVLKELNPIGPLDSAKNRRLWTILQLHPPHGPNGGDVFQSTLERILGLDDEYLKTLTRAKLHTLHSSLKIGLNERLFCVVDESQTAITTLEHAFMSHDPEDIQITARPVLRELGVVLLARENNLAVVFTGTALARVLLDAILASKFLKLGNDYRPITHFGAFSKPEDHIDYVKKYIPSDLLATRSFKALFDRIVYWLRGRYRFTSAFVRELLMSGYQLPHLRLNAFIKVATKSPLLRTLGRFTSDGFDATDGAIHLDSELEANRGDPLVITIGEQRLFDFGKIKDNVRFVELVRTYVPEMCMRSKITSTPMPLKYKDRNGRVLEDFGQLVQYGVARYDENDMGVEGDVRLLMDEPLAIRALLEWLQSCDAPLAAILRKAAVGGLQNHAGNNGVEEYIAFYCAVAFKSGAKLKEIFHFHKGLKIPEWAETSADLVSVYCTNQDSRPNDPVKAQSWTAEYDVSPVTDQSGPSNSLGYCASTISDTRRWMQHLERASICFPDKFMGPDLVMVLRLHNAQRSLIWLAIQSKFSAAQELEPSKLKEALPTVTPDGYYERRKKNAVSDEEPQPLAAHQVQILKDMDSLPNRLEIPGFDRKNKAFMRRMVDHYSGPDFSQPFDATADELAVLDGCGKHSVLRVIVGWPSLTNLHNRYSTLLQHRYFDDDCHPIVEFNRDRWNTVMEDYLLPEFDTRRHNRSRGTKQDRPDAGHEADEPGPSMKRRKTAHDLDADEFELDVTFEPNSNVETQFASQFLHPFRIGEDAGETAAWDELEHGGNPTGSVADGPPLTATDLDATTLGGQSVYDDGGHPRITERRRDGTVRLGGGEVHLRVLGHEIDPHKFWDTHRLGGMSGDLPPLKDSIPQLKLMKKRERRIWPEREDWEIETEFTQEEKGLPLQDRKKIIFERLKRAAERYEAMSYQLFCIGNPLLDMQVTKGEAILEKYDLKANDAILAEAKHECLYPEIVEKYDITYVAGGASQNTARGAAYVLPPDSVVYTGCVGDDDLAEQLKTANKREGLKEVYQVKKGEKTGACAVIITGHHRSLVTTLRVAEKFEKSHLTSELVAPLVDGAKVFYVEGYFLTHGTESIVYLSQKASAQSKIFAINFSAPFIPQFFGAALQQILPFCDLVIGNESEAETWASANGLADPKDLPAVAKAIALLPKSNPSRPRTVVITQGADSTILVSSATPDSPKIYPVTKLADAEIVDTNGAGDAFAGGFLGALVAGKSIDECVEAGHKLGSMCVQQVGPQYQWPKVNVL
ncbi:unnamed protein product [Mycena citricolor]|uniref:adenosine kinase n=1 Tax=Mycena citricolor TaxID=2018698 RepID=A0AAD2HWP1_9AGAR|nr:unnamed protein product [Mycena citricolor]